MSRKGLLVVMVLLAVLMVSATIAQAQGNPPQGPTYVGSNKCAACHQPIHESWSATLHTKMILDPAKDPAVIKADFDKLSTVITDTKLQFKKADVVLAMGWRYRQRYIIADPKTGRLVMGAGQWNLAGQGPASTDNTWQAATAGEDWLKECAGCHTTGFDLAKSQKFTAADYHAGKDKPFVELGIGCEACHGPASEHIKIPTRATIPVNKEKALDAQICGQCHTRGSSTDDKKETHQYPLGYTPGGDPTLREANWNPFMPTGVVTDTNWWVDGHAEKHRQQYLEWLPSAHATALDMLKKPEAGGQDACVRCHSADAFLTSLDPKLDPVKLAEAKFGITCQTCHDSHKTSTQPFDALLRNESYKECVACHNGGTEGGAKPIQPGTPVHHPMQEMYEGKGAIGVEGKPSPHFTGKEGQPVCASCHMPGIAKSADTGDIATHDWKIALPGKVEKGEPSACSACHINDQSKLMQMPAETLQKVIDDRQKEIGDKITALEGRIKVLGDKNTWLDAKTQAPVDAAPDAYKAAFTNVSFVKSDGSRGFHNYPYARAILTKADSDLKNIEQPPTPTPLPPTPVPPTPVPPPQPTAVPTVAAAAQAAPGTSWLIWSGLAVIVVAVLVVLMTRKPKAS